MTQLNKSALTLLFQQGDVPTGTDFANLIDSYINQQEASLQAMQGPLSTTELQTPLVSANAVNTVSLNVTGTLTTGTLSLNAITASGAAFTTLNAAGDVSANNGTVFTSAIRFGSIVLSALGSTQATAALLVASVNFGAGIVDGQTTGFRVPANCQGRVQYLTNGGASANLWPAIGGQINALTSNAAFGMVANTLYTIVHTQASGVAVK